MLRQSKSKLSSITSSTPKVKHSFTENDLAQFQRMNLENAKLSANSRNVPFAALCSLSPTFEIYGSYFPYIASPRLFQKKSPLSLSHVSEEAALGSPTPPSVPRRMLSALKRDQPLTQKDISEFQKLRENNLLEERDQESPRFFTHQKPKHQHECAFTFKIKAPR